VVILTTKEMLLAGDESEQEQCLLMLGSSCPSNGTPPFCIISVRIRLAPRRAGRCKAGERGGVSPLVMSNNPLT
jgi:hypothetical protein